jgi:hypothetical protein
MSYQPPHDPQSGQPQDPTVPLPTTQQFPQPPQYGQQPQAAPQWGQQPPPAAPQWGQQPPPAAPQWGQQPPPAAPQWGQQQPQWGPTGGAFQPGAADPNAVGPRRKGLLFTGVAITLAGIAGAIALVATANSVLEDAVTDMARAPIGCVTTLDFESAGTFRLYLETTGRTDDLRGDCAGNDATYDSPADLDPNLNLELTDFDEAAVTLERDEEADYDAAGFVGRSIERFEITEPGVYKLLVRSSDDGFAIAVGKNPQEYADNQRNLGVGLGTLAVLLGGLLILLGLRRRRPTPSRPTGPGWGQGAPGAPQWTPQPAGSPQWTPQMPQAPPAAPAPWQPAPPAAPPAPPTSGWGAPPPAP